MNVQIIARNGRPEWAVLPYEDYQKLLEQAEMLEDIQDYDRIKAAVERGEEEIIPAEVAYALIDGAHPIRVWRGYRGKSQQELAALAGISVPFLSQIETGKRRASTKTLAAIAKALEVSLDDLMMEGE